MDRLLLVGGGLANSLIAYILAGRRPELETVLIERGAALGGNHTWSFHHGDLSPAALAELKPLAAGHWPTQEVRFNSYRRTFDMPYYSLTSETLHGALSHRLGSRVRLASEVTALAPQAVELACGERLEGSVIDGRGLIGPFPVPCGYQKFVGLDVELDTPHGLSGPVIMDATVSQEAGYRFVYLLPWSERRLLIEDTYYSESAELPIDALREGIWTYAVAQGWKITRVLREEQGVLPIPMQGRLETIWPADDTVARVGLRAGLFHLTTGYSFVSAVRLAERLAAAPSFDAASLLQITRAQATENWRRGVFLRLLNRMMFLAALPEQRVRIFERFYTFSEARVARFFADRMTWLDRVRLLTGRPPVSVLRALGTIFPRPTGA